MAFDFDKFRNYSVGLLLVEDMIADCIARGDILFDLTIGDEPYKRKFGTQFETVWTLWNGATLKGRLASVMFNSPAWARSAMKHVVGSRP